jgi:hypothetical protein
MKVKLPIINFPLTEATRRVCCGGKITLKGVFLILAYYFQIVISLPLAFVQFLCYSRKIRNTSIANDPVFILGHYRSGTTYLHKLMASDRQFGYISNYDALFVNSNLVFGKKMQPVFQWLINTFRVKNPFFHNSIVLLSEPTEEDDYLMNKVSAYSAYWGLVFPKRWREWLNNSPQLYDPQYRKGWIKEYLKTLRAATFRSGGRRLVLKSPPNTERISLLLQLFPNAKFIYLYRNPYHLYYSARNMWKRAILGYYSVQKLSDAELDEIIFGHFLHLAGKYEAEKELIPPGNLAEIPYEALKSDPFAAVQKLYSLLNLPGFEAAQGDLQQQIDQEKEYTTFPFQYSEETLKKVEEQWGEYIRKWNYQTS